MGCWLPMPTVWPHQRLCACCYAAMLERMAARLDPSYDPQAANDWEACAAVLRRLYGDLEG